MAGPRNSIAEYEDEMDRALHGDFETDDAEPDHDEDEDEHGLATLDDEEDEC